MLSIADISPAMFDGSNQATFSQQYSSLYFSRLASLRAFVLSQVSICREGARNDSLSLLDIVGRIGRVSDVQEGESMLLIGTIFVDDPAKPSILSEFLQPSAHKNAAVVYLEDESGRVCINCDGIDVPLLNGSVVGLYGRQSGSTFIPSEHFHAGIPPQAPSTTSEAPCRIILVSDVDAASAEWDRCVEMLLSSHCGDAPFLVLQVCILHSSMI